MMKNERTDDRFFIYFAFSQLWRWTWTRWTSHPLFFIIYAKTRHKGGLVCKWRIEWDWQKTFLKFFMSLRRRKGGDTPVSPAPPCRTHFYREFSSLTLLYTTKTRHKGGLVCKWRIEWDSNSRYALGVHTISNRAPSTTRPSIQTSLFIKQNKIFARANFHFS